MKKLFILLAVIIITINVNAQWFLGGSVGLNATIKETPQKNIPYLDRKRDYLAGFTIAPRMGYCFTEKLAFGLEPSIGVNFVNAKEFIYNPHEGTYQSVKIEGTFVNWRIAPFLRYSVFTHKKFALILEGSVGVGGKHEIRYNTGSNSSIIGVGVINIVPVLTYKLTEKLQLEAVLNFLNLGYNFDIYMENKQKTFAHDLNIGFNAKSVFVLSQLTVGVIYKFN